MRLSHLQLVICAIAMAALLENASLASGLKIPASQNRVVVEPPNDGDKKGDETNETTPQCPDAKTFKDLPGGPFIGHGWDQNISIAEGEALLDCDDEMSWAIELQWTMEYPPNKTACTVIQGCYLHAAQLYDKCAVQECIPPYNPSNPPETEYHCKASGNYDLTNYQCDTTPPAPTVWIILGNQPPPPPAP